MCLLTWELVGAVVGAGLASGREIAAFFSRYGGWSIAGIIVAVVVICVLADTRLPSVWQGKWPERVWNILLSLLLIATGGAMLSGAGEVASLMLPVHGAYWLGLLGTLVLAWFLAHRTVAGLAWVSRILLGVLTALIVLGLTLPPMKAASIYAYHPAEAVVRGMTYGGFNASLQAPIMAMALNRTAKERKRAAWMAGLLIFLLLMLGNAVLLRHPALIAEPMPFMQMLHAFGKPGYYLGGISLYLAILSTLTACMRGLKGGILSGAGILLVSLLGFTGVVEIAYPLLGGGCFLMLLAAKLMNSCPNPFHSRKDML